MDILARWHRMRGLRRALAARPRPRRHRHADGRRARAGQDRQRSAAARWAARPSSPRSGSGRSSPAAPSSSSRRRLGDSLRPVAQPLHHGRGLPRRGAARSSSSSTTQGLIFRGKRLVNWDPHFETAISDLEVEQVETRGHLWRLRYPLEDGATYQHPVACDDDGRADRLRDPRLPRRRHHPPRDHARRHRRRGAPRRRALRATSSARPCACRWSAARSRSSPTPTPTRRRAPARSRSPRRTTSTTGTVGQRHGLARDQRDGHARSHRAQGQRRLLGGRATRPTSSPTSTASTATRRASSIVTLAEEQGWLDGIDAETHTVPHGDRSKVAIEPFLTDQWYVDAATLAEPGARRGPRRAAPASCPSATRRPTSTGWRTSSPGASRASSGGGTRIPVWYGPTRRAEGHRLRRPGARSSRSARLTRSTAARLRGLLRRRARTRREEPRPGTRSRIGRESSSASRASARSRPASSRGAGHELRHAAPRPRRPRHLVLLRHLADRHARLARGHAGARGATTRPACSSPASTSSSSGSPG